MKKTLFVIDAYNLIYRMFYAIPEMTTRSGEYVNAIFGVAKFLRALAIDNPDAALIVTTDVGASFRSEIYTEYKGTRDRMPDNLRSQIEGVFALFAAAGIETLSREGYEADDIIGSIAHQHENNEYQIVIVSSDKDLCQFVRDGHVHIFDAMKQKFLKEKDVIEKFGVPYQQVCDYLAIVGDSSDNIPGIAGFGPKKAVDLLSKYGTLE
jgi:DNA polymerase-1